MYTYETYQNQWFNIDICFFCNFVSHKFLCGLVCGPLFACAVHRQHLFLSFLNAALFPNFSDYLDYVILQTIKG